jgi:hypothetical protein
MCNRWPATVTKHTGHGGQCSYLFNFIRIVKLKIKYIQAVVFVIRIVAHVISKIAFLLWILHIFSHNHNIPILIPILNQ